MELPEIIDEYTNFVLTYAKQDGLNGLVRRLKFNKEKKCLEADLQPDLIHAFAENFPDVELSKLDSTVEWIILISSTMQPTGE